MNKITCRISMKEIWISSLAYSIFSLGLVTGVEAETLTLNFDSLPSNQGWTYSGSPLAEDAAFSVGNSSLVQTTVGSGSSSTSTYEIRNIVDSNKFMTLSFTARVLSYEDISCGTGCSIGQGFIFQISDSGIGHAIGLTDSQINVDDRKVALDTTIFHDYVFIMHPDRSSDLFVDGVLLVSDSGFGAGFTNIMRFGDRASDENTDAEISALSFAVAAPDIDVRKSVNNKFPAANEPVEFTIDVSNMGDQTAAEVVIIDQLPTEMVIPVGTAPFTSVGSYDPVTGEWSVGDLDAGDSAVLSIPAVVTEPQPPTCIVNTALSQFQDLSGDANDEARAAIHQVGVERCVELDVKFGISAHPPIFIFPTCNSEERYDGDVELTNNGPDAARNVVLTIMQNPVVGPNLRFDDADCSNAPSSQCNITEIAAGETVTIDVTSDPYQSHNSFTQTISVSATTSDVDYDLSNNSPSGTGSAGGFSSCDENLPDIPCLGFLCPAGSSGCFIATAAYGSPLDPHLDSLRDFRDRFMMTNRPGRALVRFYYRHSPPLADFIAKRDWLRAIVRGLLAPMVYTIKYPGLAALLLIGVFSFVVVRRWRHVKTT